MLGRHLKLCEDSLTGSVFSHLLHLPADLFWQILRDACGNRSLPRTSGEPRAEFWPKWSATGTDNSTYAEPDVFVRFTKFDLIIEAKRWDADMQSVAQWQRQLNAYVYEHGDRRRPVIIIALGTGRQVREQQLSPSWPVARISADDARERPAAVCRIISCRWSAVLHRCRCTLSALQRIPHPSAQDSAHVRVLQHTIALFGWHGFPVGRWFADFNFVNHRLRPSVADHLQLFQRRTDQLSRA